MELLIVIMVFLCAALAVSSQSIAMRGYAVAGRSLTLECNITRATNDDLTWTRVVGQSSSIIYASPECNQSIPVSSSSPAGLSGGCQLVNGEEVYTVTIENVTEGTGRGRWVCQFGASTVNVSLDVKVMVTRVNLTNPPNTMLAGDTSSFTCVTSASKPQACIRGYIRNSGNVREIDPPADCNQNPSSVQTTTRTLTFTASAEENGAELYCNASNNVTDPPVRSQLHILNVQFGPDSVQLTGDPGQSRNTVNVKEKSTVTFTCTSGESNPAAILSWYNNSSPIAPAEISQASSERGPNHGYLTKQRYTVRADRYQDDDFIRCDIQRPGDDTTKRVSPSLKLDVTYGPMFTSCAPSYIFVENVTAELSCTIWAKPEPSIIWSRVAQPKRIVTNHRYTSVVRFNNISRTESGVYTVTAKNSVGGENRQSVSVTVFYPPVVSVVLVSGGEVIEGNPLQLECRAEAVPQNFTYSAWSRTIGNRIVPLTNHSSGKSLSISQVTFRDQGVYRCGANNGFGGVQGGQLEVKIKARPLFPSQMNEQAASIGENVKLTVKFVANPSYKNFTWYKMTNGLTGRLTVSGQPGSKYRSHVMAAEHEFVFYNTTVVLSGHLAELDISNVGRQDFGLYTLSVENEVGVSKVSILFVLKDRPCSPLLGTAICGSESANISWISCFNGGSTQTFVIEYKRESEEWNQWRRDIPDPGEGKTVMEEVTGLDSGLHSFRVYGQNKWNKSEPSVTSCVVAGADSQTRSSVVVPAVLTSVVVIVTIALAVFIYLWRRAREANASNKDMTNSPEMSHTESTRNPYEALHVRSQASPPPTKEISDQAPPYVNIELGVKKDRSNGKAKAPAPATAPKPPVYVNENWKAVGERQECKGWHM